MKTYKKITKKKQPSLISVFFVFFPIRNVIGFITVENKNKNEINGSTKTDRERNIKRKLII
jgi:hypothetical protein